MPAKVSFQKYSKIKELIKEDNILEAGHLALSLGKRLGAGCDREAFLIHPERYKKPIVLKIDSFYHKTYDRNAEQTKNEIRIFERYNHKFIPKIFDWDCDEYRWLEMEYLEAIPYPYKEIPSDEDIMKFSNFIRGAFREHSKRDHWGLDSKGQPKILDLGF